MNHNLLAVVYGELAVCSGYDALPEDIQAAEQAYAFAVKSVSKAESFALDMSAARTSLQSSRILLDDKAYRVSIHFSEEARRLAEREIQMYEQMLAQAEQEEQQRAIALALVRQREAARQAVSIGLPQVDERGAAIDTLQPRSAAKPVDYGMMDSKCHSA